MSNQIILNAEEIEEHAGDFSTAAQYFNEKPLNPSDNLSDITANGNAQATFKEEQKALAMLGENLDLEAETMRNMNLMFLEYDEMMAKLIG